MRESVIGSPTLAAAIALVLGAVIGIPAGGAEADLAALARHFESAGLEPLPGQPDIRVEAGVAGLYRGTPSADDPKSYVLLTGSASSVEALTKLVQAGAEGIEVGGRHLPPLLERLGRHVVIAYREDGSLAAGLISLDKVVAHIDLSGVASTASQRLILRAVGSSPSWPALIEQANVPVGLDLEVVEAPDLGRSSAPELYGRGIPGLQLIADGSRAATGSRDSVSDIAAFAALLAAKLSRLDEAPAFQRVEETTRSETARPTSSRPYTGTIPDYTGDGKGLRLSGVLDEGPAAAAGLREGDVIVELGRRAVTDVYSYAEALDELVVGDPVTVVFLRDGERMETVITPLARE